MGAGCVSAGGVRSGHRGAGSAAGRGRRRGGGDPAAGRPCRGGHEAEPPFALAVESIAEDLDAKRVLLARAERLLARRRHPHHEHVVALHLRARGRPRATRALRRLALVQPGRARPAGRGRRRRPDRAGDPRAPARALARARQAAGRRAARRPRLRRQPPAVRAHPRGVRAGGGRRLRRRGRRPGGRAGLGARWAAIGPFASMDAAGLEVHEAAAARLFPELSRATDGPAPAARAAQRRRDRRCAAAAGCAGRTRPRPARQLAARRDATLALLAERPA